jgi:hypothetical protein
MKTINKQVCPHCGQSVNKRKINLDKTLVRALVKIYQWCQETGRHEFERHEIKHLFKTETETATFGNWVHFGGIFYKTGGRGHWGINLPRAAEFLTGKSSITLAVWHDPITNTNEVAETGTIHRVKGIAAFISPAGEFVVEYKK